MNWICDEISPLNVELSTLIKSRFKWTIINVKIIFRLGFSVNLQNLPDLRWHWRWWLLCFSEESTSPNLNFCGCIEVHDWKGIYKVQFHLRGHYLRRFWCENRKFSSRPPRLAWPTANWICDEISREIFLSSVRFSKAVYLRWINTDKPLFVIFNLLGLFPKVDDWNEILPY